MNGWFCGGSLSHHRFPFLAHDSPFGARTLYCCVPGGDRGEQSCRGVLGPRWTYMTEGTSTKAIPGEVLKLRILSERDESGGVVQSVPTLSSIARYLEKGRGSRFRSARISLWDGVSSRKSLDHLFSLGQGLEGFDLVGCCALELGHGAWRVEGGNGDRGRRGSSDSDSARSL